LAIRPWVKARVIREAGARGILLEPGSVDFDLHTVEIHDAGFSLSGVTGLRGRAEHITVHLTGLEPERIELSGVYLQLEGSVAALALELTEWSKDFPRVYSLPLGATGMNIAWRSAPGQSPWLVMEGGRVLHTDDGGSFQADRAMVSGASLGTVGAQWKADQSTVALGLGRPDLEKAPVRVRIQHTQARPSADITLVPTDITELADPFGVKIPLQSVIASGGAHLEFQPEQGQDLITGTLQIQLKGFVPPHPVELDGFIFGDVTTFSSKFVISKDRRVVTLQDVEVTAAKFKLKGTGSITRMSDHAQIQLDLHGSLPCAALAGAVAESRLGQLLGQLAGQLAGSAARQWTIGSVAISVRIDADSRDLAGARVDRRIGVGCGLRPIEIPGLDLSKLPALPPGVPSSLASGWSELLNLPGTLGSGKSPLGPNR
ncbi:MAG TPA: hypothetical protein VGJ84_05565, partial [Polyangiaceae bacterium]